MNVRPRLKKEVKDLFSFFWCLLWILAASYPSIQPNKEQQSEPIKAVQYGPLVLFEFWSLRTLLSLSQKKELQFPT
ncbi:MAG: hypothetical protein BGO67_02755 [Alphaproteobacteria bacterium 41-28]|nr:MAG: hypothetical protein BGO67_02755 [Alphaproteobacteria bacterium 41-28]